MTATRCMWGFCGQHVPEAAHECAHGAPCKPAEVDGRVQWAVPECPACAEEKRGLRVADLDEALLALGPRRCLLVRPIVRSGLVCGAEVIGTVDSDVRA